VAATQTEYLSMHPEPEFAAAAVSAATDTDQALFKRRLDLRVMGVQRFDPAELPPDPVASNRYRSAPRIPMKLLVFDRRIALFPVDPRDHARGYLEVGQQPVVESLVELFERNWHAAADDIGAAVPTIRLTTREQALLSLLVAGHTDASAAGHLQISERTVTSIMRSLMDRIQVDNRFQLGVALGAMRVIQPPGSTDPNTETEDTP
jgi:DNA-binding CsgD family transcriptional regulator